MQMIQKADTSGGGTRRRFFGRAEFVGLVVMIVVVGGLVVDATKTDSDNFYADIIRLDNVATKIHQSYVEEIPSEDLVDKAVEGMLEVLDPHTSFFKKKQYDELRIHTEGKFGGLGIQISIRDKVLTVMTPISGTPASRAGLQSGDQIVEIEGKSTKGITIEEAVNKLRGEPGTDVSITIRRRGESKDLEYTITREIITIHAVPFYGMLENNIGYVRLLSFSQEAGDEVEKSLKALLDRDLKGLILDLRHNPGGLLPQAIEVAEKFLGRKSLVVSTRGRLRGQNKEFYASSSPVLPDAIPLVVLVSAASASASEIVAGAIQDWDRGIIMGDTTFGKGSVQSILPLDKDHHLKLTTAYYYTPSGRCISKPENAVHLEDGDGDSVEAAADSVEQDTTVYTTKAGRIVYGGGGIVPDTIVENELPELAVRRLLLKDVFFKFANSQYPRLRKRKAKLNAAFTVSDALMEGFHAFLDSIDFEYSSHAKAEFEAFKQHAGLIDSSEDTTGAEDIEKPAWTDAELAELKRISARVDSVLQVLGKREFSDSEDEIKRLIKEALLVREHGQDNEIVYRVRLIEDDQVGKAIALLLDNKSYASLLEPPAKPTDGGKKSKKK
ncbi:MAG: PDZ domain-containing protein [Chitinivibrionales bacterium]|nr:PDZ domain-containing protein [Chitinivibrionales bacterium]MBD3394068.1 PDZ domain-containing protein [Chitinivibrionales bacterium]